MRLLDKILSKGFRMLKDIDLNATQIKEYLGSSQLVVIDNVADYFYTHQTDDFFTVASFPNVMLPFEFCFLEFRFRQQWEATIGCGEVGVLMMMREPDLRKEIPELIRPAGVKYHLFCYVFILQPHSDDVWLFAEEILPVGSDGQLLSPNDRVHASTRVFVPDAPPEKARRDLRFVHQYVGFPVLSALSFMHCRNVKVVTERPPEKLSKKHEKKTGRPLLKYRLLQIDHMKQVLEREGGASSQGLSKALHICRGHFSKYGKDGNGLLFGKHAGTFWVPMHIRGSAEEGVMAKDYKVT